MKLQDYDIKIDAISISETYAGLLEGFPPYCNEGREDYAKREAARHFGERKTTYLSPCSLNEWFPEHQILCMLTSRVIGLHTDDWDGSEAVVIFYYNGDIHSQNISDVILNAIKDLKWEEIAENWSI